MPKEWGSIIIIFVFTLFILSAIILFFQWIFKIPGNVAKTQKWFNPNEEKSPLRKFFLNLKDPEHNENPFYEILKKESGQLPSTLNEIKAHVDRVSDLVSKLNQDATKISNNNYNFTTWGDSWKDNANRALALLEREGIKSHLLTFKPEEYPKMLIDEGFIKSEDPATEITLIGSMAGFYVLLPQAIRNYICCLGNRFKTLNIIATNKYYETTHRYQLPNYALAFVSKTVKYILEGRCQNSFKKDEPLSFTINICFAPFDFMNAAIMMEDRSIAILQALDPKSVEGIIDDGIQIGFKVRKHDQAFRLGQAYFERYEKVINGYFEDLDDTMEKWSLYGNKKSVTLTIENPHWDSNYDYKIKPIENSRISFTKNSEEDKIGEFLNNFSQKVRLVAGTKNLDENEHLQKRFDLPCNCEKSKK